MNKLYLIIPVYNEENCIEDVIREWYPVVCQIGNESKLIILNDGSTDHTFKVISQLIKEYPKIELINKKNTGHGPTCLYGYNYAIENHADYIFQTDSDGQTEASEFWKFWIKRNEADFIIGYRKIRKDGLLRWIISKILRIVILILFKTYVKDSNVPFRLMNVVPLQKYLSHIPNNFYLANSLLTTLLVMHKENINWEAIHFNKRTGGMPSVTLRRFYKVGCMVIKDFRDYYKTIKEDEYLNMNNNK